MQPNHVSSTDLTSFVPLAAAIIGLLAATIAFVNGRLSEARTREKRKRVLLITYDIGDLAIFLLGCFLVQSRELGKLGIIVLCVSLVSLVAGFLLERVSNIRLAVLELVFRFNAVGFFILLFLLSRLVDLNVSVVDLLRDFSRSPR